MKICSLHPITAEMLLFVSTWYEISFDFFFTTWDEKKWFPPAKKKKAIWADLQAQNETPRCFSVALWSASCAELNDVHSPYKLLIISEGENCFKATSCCCCCCQKWVSESRVAERARRYQWLASCVCPNKADKSSRVTRHGTRTRSAVLMETQAAMQ